MKNIFFLGLSHPFMGLIRSKLFRRFAGKLKFLKKISKNGKPLLTFQTIFSMDISSDQALAASFSGTKIWRLSFFAIQIKDF